MIEVAPEMGFEAIASKMNEILNPIKVFVPDPATIERDYLMAIDGIVTPAIVEANPGLDNLSWGLRFYEGDSQRPWILYLTPA